MTINRSTCFAIALAAALAPAAATANDSTATLGAGGLQLVRNEAVELLSEDLFVSTKEVRVAYRFRNKTAEPVTVLVAFPLPPIDAIVPEEMNIVLPDPASDNFVDFTVTVDGKSVTPSVSERATMLGIDRTEELRKRGLPLNPLADGLYQTIDAMPKAEQEALAALGLLYIDPYSAQPAWRYEATFYWQQTFPPGEEVAVEHRYKPVVGYGFFGDHVFGDEWYKRYCFDDGFEAAARKKLAAVAGTQNPYLSEQRISYILTTANNWSGPIGTFRLVVDKGSPDAIVSFCGEGVTKTSPTTFEMTATGYVPTKDLDVLIAAPPAPQ